jgi:flagellar biogenesis protein FliO
VKELAPLFVILLAFVFVAGWKMRLGQRFSPLCFSVSRQKRNRALEVMDLVHLSSQSSVHLVRARNKVLVLGVSNSGVTVLDSFSAEQSSSEAESAPGVGRQLW